MNIGNSIKKIRQLAGVTQLELRKKAKLSQGYLSNIETGRQTPSPKVIKKIAKALDIPPGLILAMSIENEDVQVGKKRLYKKLKPVIDDLVTEALILHYGH